jgi:hypothetical protein
MSAINHGMEVPTNSRREVLMGYQYALHQQKKKLREEKSEPRRSHENNRASSNHTEMNTAKHVTPASKDIANQSITEEKHHVPGKRTVREVSAHHHQTKRKTSYKKRQKQP